MRRIAETKMLKYFLISMGLLIGLCIFPNDSMAVENTDVNPTQIVHPITVTEDGNGIAIVAPKQAKAGQEIGLGAAAYMGYRFKEWKVLEGGVEIRNNSFIMPDSPVRIEAVFEEINPATQTHNITIESDKGGVAIASQTQAKSGESIRLEARSVEGYKFKEWKVVQGDTAVKNSAFVMPEGDVKIKAVFEDTRPKSYSVSIVKEGDGLTYASPAVAAVGQKVYLSAASYTGYRFKEWQVVQGDIKLEKNSFVMPDGPVVVKAVFDKLETNPYANERYNVKLDIVGDGVALASVDKAVPGDKVYLRGRSNEGYRFKEWRVVEGDVKVENNAFVMPRGNVKIEAVFARTEDPIPGKPISIYNNGHGVAIAMDKSAAPGKKVNLAAASYEGYKFKRWDILQGDITIVNNSFIMPETPVKIRAIFEERPDKPPVKEQYKVSVDTEGEGVAISSVKQAKSGTVVSLEAVAGKDNYFKEWQVLSGDVQIKDNKFTMPEGEVRIKAVFDKDPSATTENTIEVTTDGRGIAVSAPKQAVPGQKVELGEAAHIGYRFKEWRVLEGDVRVQQDSFIMPNKPVRLMAVFEEVVDAQSSEAGGAPVAQERVEPYNNQE